MFGNWHTGEQSTKAAWLTPAFIALLPVLCVLWFMAVAMRNERLAVQQRLTDVYLNHLASAQRQLALYWRDKEAILRSATNGTPAEIFAALVRSKVVESVMVQDETGQVAYPTPPAALVTGRVEEPAEWLLARELEFQKTNYLAAAETYGRVARETVDVNMQVRARQSQAGCLLKAGQNQRAIELLTQMSQDTRFRRAVGELGIAIIPNLQLLVLRLVNNRTNETFRRTWTELVARLNDYGDALLPASQRRFLMEELQSMVPDATVFPTLDAEKLAADYLDRNPVMTAEPALRPAGLAGIWCFSVTREPVGPERTFGAESNGTQSRRPNELAGNERAGKGTRTVQATMVALFRENRLRREMSSAFNALSLPGVSVKLLAPGEAFAPNRLLPPLEAGEVLPGWRLALTFVGSDPFAIASARQTRLYLWSGVFVVLIIGLTAIAAARYLGAQMRLARLKDELVSTVTHELKTPLAAMRALVDTLLAGRYRDAQQLESYLKLAAHENQRLSHLIENFLTFSRLERNKQKFHFETVTAEALVNQAVTALQERLHTAGCQFEVNIAPGLPAFYGDPDALETVLINLLDNAWKYTEKQKRIAVRAYQENGAVLLAVTDNGIGLTSQEARKVFDRFYQADQGLTRRAGGCGLGLSIVQSIVKAHGGSVSVESAPGQGSTFTVRLPLEGPSKRTNPHEFVVDQQNNDRAG